MKKAFIMIISVITMVTLAKCGYDEIIYEDMIPKINPYPIQKVRIHGKFPFDKNITLTKITATYINDNPKCDTVYIGARIKKIEAIDIVIKKISNNGYEVNYYQDYFLPGACEWKFDVFLNNISSKSYNIRFGGYSNHVFYRHPKDYKSTHYAFSDKVTYECHIDKVVRLNRKPEELMLCDWAKDKNGKTISPYQNAMDIEQDFIYKKGEIKQWQ